ncbi:uncharacterized protein [Maniola hyperantus]|uniref:uncharacterized protein n=1 Tax=Aphantopus hyperantus TaxID=2795564 RepID=UPI003747D202
MSKDSDGYANANNTIVLRGENDIQQEVMLVEEHQYNQEEEVDMTLEVCREEDLRAQKRTRSDDEESEWTTVGSRGKKTKPGNDSIEIYISSSEILPKQFAMAKLFKKNNLSDIERVKYISPFKIRLHVPNEISAKKLENCREFIDKGWRIYRALEKDISYGIIRGVDLDLSSEEIAKSIECPNEIELLSIMRLDRRSDTAVNGWTPSECVRLCFRGKQLPQYISVDGLKINIEPYIFRVSQCSKCWRLGHILRRCPSFKVICPKCGGNHDNCTTTTYKCVNCNGNHMAMSKTCPSYLKERKLREIMAELNCTYKKALSVYVPLRPERPPNMPDCPSSPILPTTSYTSANINKPPASSDTSTYAHVVKTTAIIHKPTSSHSTAKTTKTPRRRFEDMEEITKESEDLYNTKEKENNSNQQNNRIPFLELLSRLKNILFLKGIPIQLKIKNIAKKKFTLLL